MTQEEKQLLIKDLCAREPYHPRIQVFNDGYEGFQDGEFDTDLWLHHIDAFRFDRIVIRPYLRPMSSMTEEERAELKDTTCPESTGYFDERYLICPINHFGELIGYDFMSNILDWLNAHHFDVRGLIEKGLALEDPDGMYKTE